MNQHIKISTKRILGHRITVTSTQEPGVKCETLSLDGKPLGQVRSIKRSKDVTYELSDGSASGIKQVGQGGKSKEKLFTELRQTIVELTVGADE